MKKLWIVAALGLGMMISSVHAQNSHQIPQEELQNAEWSVLKEKQDKTVYYRTQNANSRKGVWIKKVDNKGETEYKHFKTDCSGENPVVKDAEIEVKKNGRLERESSDKIIRKTGKAKTIRNLICEA